MAVIASQLFEVSPVDPVSLLTAVLFLLAIASAAIGIPTRKAASVDPIVAIRVE
jgi:hypothetical protein